MIASSPLSPRPHHARGVELFGETAELCASARASNRRSLGHGAAMNLLLSCSLPFCSKGKPVACGKASTATIRLMRTVRYRDSQTVLVMRIFFVCRHRSPKPFVASVAASAQLSVRSVLPASSCRCPDQRCRCRVAAERRCCVS